MGLFDAFRMARIDSVAKNTKERGLQQGTHSENCERCKFSVSNRKSPTGVSCTRYSAHVPANGVCGDYAR